MVLKVSLQLLWYRPALSIKCKHPLAKQSRMSRLASPTCHTLSPFLIPCLASA